ncbi:MAG TPA: carboxypeptidase regulatory-like domain-containing protein [Blastocatellia bacterium]|nr:carboxypeptidase regulatory-like domain-containing protein [Blastocatellia bacterium]
MARILFCVALILTLTIAVAGQTPSGVVQVSGVVLNTSEEVIPGASIILRRNDGSKPPTVATSDARGAFRFSQVASGDYEIEIRKNSFKPAIIQVSVGAPASTPLRIVLEIPDLLEEIAVQDRSGQVNTIPSENLDVVKLDRDALNNLPVLGNDVIGAVANLVDASSTGSGGVTVLVDGLETTRKVPANMIQEVRINQNPYSAEFARPGRGRIEVITKAGASEYHGEFGVIFRDSRLDARNAFALERPPEQRRIYEGALTGPLGRGKKTSFFFNGNREEEDLQVVVFARTPAGLVSENVATPQRQSEFSFRVNHQIGEKTTYSIRFEFTEDSSRNNGVGGFNLPEAAADSRDGEHHIFITHRRIISPKLINEITLRAGHEYGGSRSIQQGIPRLIVQDSFTGGGGQADRRTTENHVQLNEIFSWTKAKHFVRGGLNVPDISRRGFSDQSNFGGTFTFVKLEDYLNNRPFLYSINLGDGHMAFWQKEFGLFAQDQILARSNFSVALGLRYDKQNYLGDKNNFSPRISFAYSPDKKRKTVLRGGGGIFYDRTGINPIADKLRFDGLRLRQVNILNPGYPDPFSSGSALAAQPSAIFRFAPDLRSPYTFQFNMGVERQLAKSLTLTANYVSTHGVKLFRPRDLNAPLPPYPSPPDLPRPDPTIGILRELESAGRSETHALELLLRGRMSRFFNGTVQYTLGRAYNNTGGINSRPANNYDLTGEWSRADFDERHRFNILGAFKAGDWLNLGMTVALTSGRPYSLTTGRDDNHDTIANDRPVGVRRNSLQGPGAATLDLRWSKEFYLKAAKNGKKADEGPVVKVGLSAFNALNRVNYIGYVGNQSSQFFGLPVAARPARRLQLNVNFSF